MSEPEKTASSDRVIKLTIGERLALLNELPQRCGHITGLIVKDIMERLGTTQKDVEIYNLRDGGVEGRILWDSATADIQRDFTLNNKEVDVLVPILQKLDKDNNLPLQLARLYELIVLGKDDSPIN